VNEVLEAVSLCLFDYGPLPATEISIITGLPLPTLRTHLRLNLGHRYQAAMALESGVPIRRWSLLPADPKESE
jgi:hypothetical protein